MKRWLRRHGTAVALACGAGLCCAPAGAQTFQKAYGTGITEVSNDTIWLRDCHYASVGYQSPAVGIRQIHALRTDGNGSLIWSRIYLVGGDLGVPSSGYTLVESRDESLLYGAESAFIAGGALGKVAMRVSPAGVPIWLVILSGTPFAPSLAGSPTLGVSIRDSVDDGRVLTVNRLDDIFGFSRVGVLSTVSAAGVFAQTAVYLPAAVSPDRVELDFAEIREAPAFLPPGSPKRDLVVVGNYLDPALGRYSAFAMRTDSTGIVKWSRYYTHPDPDVSLTADGFDFDREGNIVMSGRTGQNVLPGAVPTDLFVAKVDYAAGVPIWSEQVPRFLNGYQAVELTENRRSVVIAGTVDAGVSAALLVFDTVSGALLRGARYGAFAPGSTNRGNDVAVPPFSGGYLLDGSTTDFGGGLEDDYFVKTLTDLSSGCRESKISPPVTLFEIGSKELPLERVSLPMFENLNVVTTTFGAEFTACFKPRCVGDLNGDGLVDDEDFVIFAGAYNILICPTSPRFDCCPADLNGDGFVDDADFVIFVAAYNALLCP